jgi:hypothetical protein
MKRINVKQAKPGMILAQPITDGQGRTIIKQGATLTKLYISRLDKWGVTEVCIEESGDAAPRVRAPGGAAGAAGTGQTDAGAAPADTGALPGVRYGPKLASEIDRTFARVSDDPLMAALRDAVKRQLSGQSSGAGA